MASSLHQGSLRLQAKRHAAEASVHMSVLGMDESDRDVEMSCRQAEMSRVDVATSDDKTMQESSLGSGLLSDRSEAPRLGRGLAPSMSASLSRRSHTHGVGDSSSTVDNANNWLGKLLWGKTTSEDADDDDTITKYQSLEPPESEGSLQNARIDGYTLATGAMSASSTQDTPSTNTTATIEDRLKKNCSFFYQGMENHSASSSRNHRRLQLSEGTRFISLTSSLNHSMPRFMSSLEASRFRTRYEKLNNDIVPAENDDLVFDEHQERLGRRTSTVNDVVDFTRTATASQNTGKLSTLFFEQNGRLLMKLPRDQIRLIMDQDLEPGILSVEQWRKLDRDNFDPAGFQDARMAILEDDAAKVNNATQPPPLRYVMTVPDDLYRRVVAEMSYALLPPCWGFFNCCNATDGKADIKIALVILAVILFFMFVSTMVWPTD